MRKKIILVLGVAVILGIALAIWRLWLIDERSEEVLRWQDPATNITFLVTETPGAIVHTFTHLRVSRVDAVQSVQLDDDSCFGLAGLVRWQDWLLVLNDGHVLGGYNYSTGLLYGEHQWGQLPFTVRSSAGEIVAEKRVRDGGTLPAQFPQIREPAPSPDK